MTVYEESRDPIPPGHGERRTTDYYASGRGRFGVSIDRDYGPDETFEVETEEDALAAYEDAIRDEDVRRVYVSDYETGRTVEEWSR